MAYKKLIKVSNVCQLLDKSKYLATTTKDGITWTNNGDGTITIDGTAIENPVHKEFFVGALDETHKYLFTATTQPCVWGQTYGMTCTGGGDAGFDNGNGKIFTNEKNLSLIAYVWRYNTVSNLTFKPQLFDLTEMYRAGHEPTTVEQFRQDFPDEMYDYSPHCWLTSYKRVIVTGNETYPVLTAYRRNLTCKTKNLFDYTKVSGLRQSTTGASLNNFLIINGTSFRNRYGVYAGGTHIIPSFILKAGTYTISLLAKGTAPGNSGVFGIVKFNSDGTQTDFQSIWTSSDSRQSYTFTLDEDSEVAIRIQGYGNASNYLNLDSTFKDIQLELGDTATDYVPYGHL